MLSLWLYTVRWHNTSTVVQKSFFSTDHNYIETPVVLLTPPALVQVNDYLHRTRRELFSTDVVLVGSSNSIWEYFQPLFSHWNWRDSLRKCHKMQIWRACQLLQSSSPGVYTTETQLWRFLFFEFIRQNSKYVADWLKTPTSWIHQTFGCIPRW